MDMGGQVEFYTKILGLKIGYPLKDDYSRESWVQFNTGECSLCLHSGGNGKIGQDAPRFTFEVQDINKAKVDLEKNGVKVSEIREAAPGKYVFNFKDPEGNDIAVEYFGIET